MTTTVVKSGGWTVFPDGVITFAESGVQLWTDNVERMLKSERTDANKSRARIWNGCAASTSQGLDGSLIRTLHIQPSFCFVSETASPVKIRCVSYRGETWYEIQEDK